MARFETVEPNVAPTLPEGDATRTISDDNKRKLLERSDFNRAGEALSSRACSCRRYNSTVPAPLDAA